MATFEWAYFMPQQERTTVCLNKFNGSMNTLKEALDKKGLNLSERSFSIDSESLKIDGFSEDYSESKDQIEYLLEVLGISKYIYNWYEFHRDLVWFESINFNGATLILTNFLSSPPWRPKWAEFLSAGEIVNYGDEIYAIKLPRFKSNHTFVYPITENEFNSFTKGLNHRFAFNNGMFLQINEFPPIFLLKGFTYAVDFLERFLEYNRFDLTDYGEHWFPGEDQVESFYL